jgi:hypothetical protein
MYGSSSVAPKEHRGGKLVALSARMAQGPLFLIQRLMIQHLMMQRLMIQSVATAETEALESPLNSGLL